MSTVTSITQHREAKLRDFENKREVTEAEWVRVAMSVKMPSENDSNRVLKFETKLR